MDAMCASPSLTQNEHAMMLQARWLLQTSGKPRFRSHYFEHSAVAGSLRPLNEMTHYKLYYFGQTDPAFKVIRAVFGAPTQFSPARL